MQLLLAILKRLDSTRLACTVRFAASCIKCARVIACMHAGLGYFTSARAYLSSFAPIPTLNVLLALQYMLGSTTVVKSASSVSCSEHDAIHASLQSSAQSALSCYHENTLYLFNHTPAVGSKSDLCSAPFTAEISFLSERSCPRGQANHDHREVFAGMMERHDRSRAFSIQSTTVHVITEV